MLRAHLIHSGIPIETFLAWNPRGWEAWRLGRLGLGGSDVKGVFETFRNPYRNLAGLESSRLGGLEAREARPGRLGC